MGMQLRLLFAAVCITLTAALPSGNNPQSSTLQLRQTATADCSNILNPFSSSCWDTLGVAQYLQTWSKNVPTCKDKDGDGDNCCKANEPWSTCFLRAATGTPAIDCTSISSQKCSGDLSLNPKLPSESAAQFNYVVHNIVRINTFFSKYYKDLASTYSSIREHAQDPLSGGPSDYTNLQGIVGPGTQKATSGSNSAHPGFSELAAAASINSGNSLKAMVAGLPLLYLAENIPGSPKDTWDHTQVKNFMKGLTQAPSVVSAMFGAGFDSPNLVDSSPPPTIPSLESLLQAGVGLLMNDSSTFIKFASGGTFSGPDTELGSDSQGSAWLTTAASTYVVSEVLSQNKFSASPAGTAAQSKLQSGRNCTDAGDICQDDQTTYYWSASTQMQYQISFNGEGTGNISSNAYNLLSWLEEHSNTNMPVLFDGAYNCTLTGKAGGAVINFDKARKMDISCLSAVPIYLPKGAPCPQGAVQVNGKCPFGHNP